MFNFLKNIFSQKEGQKPDLDPEEILKSLQPQIDRYATDCIRISTQSGINLKLENSKFGGLPYFPKNEKYPTDSNGKPMRLLAQLNFTEIPNLPPFPENGLLQIFLSDDDDIYGFDYDHPTKQGNWRIQYFENLDFEPTENLDHLFKNEWKYSPFLVESLGLEFEIKKDYPSYPSLEYYRDIEPIFQKVEDGDYEDFLCDLYLDNEYGLGHKIGGAPYFTQSEIREYKAGLKDYILLFQIDSEDNKIIWGDVGVANFFIHPKDLKKRNFSKVAYNWDCT